MSHGQAVDLGGSVSAARIFRVPGGRLPSDLSHFFVGLLALVLQDAAWWLALCARRLRAVSVEPPGRRGSGIRRPAQLTDLVMRAACPPGGDGLRGGKWDHVGGPWRGERS